MKAWQACMSLVGMLVVGACASASSRTCQTVPDSAGLRHLATAADSTLVALTAAPDSQELRQRLRGMIDRVVLMDGCGALVRTVDLRMASEIATRASMLGNATVERAYVWARRTVVADPDDRRNWRVMAIAWDQMQVMKRQQQWFATVIDCGTAPDDRCGVAPIDTTRVTDSQRIDLGLRTLTQQRMAADSMNRAQARLP